MYILRTSLNSICKSNDFYSNSMEKYLNIKIETETLEKSFSKIIKDNSIKTLENYQKQSIQEFILTQLLRTPANIRRKLEMIKWIKTLPKDVYDKSIHNEDNYIPQKNLPSTKEEYLNMFERNINLASRFPQLIDNFKLYLLINNTNAPFYTSDNPIIDKTNFLFWNNNISEFKINSKILPKLIIPLNPRILIVFEKDSNMQKTYSLKRYIKNYNNILKINNDIIRNAEEIVLMKSNNLHVLKSAIKISNKCLEKKHYIYKEIKVKRENVKKSYLVKGNQEIFACKLCGKKFNTKEGAKNHLDKYCKKKKY